MGSVVGNSVVSYCCVWKGGRILYEYKNNNSGEIENLAALCLEMAPPHHRWYFQTMDNNTYGFFMDDGHVYFAIVHQSRVNSHVLRFLQKLRDEFKGSVVGKKKGALNSHSLQEQMSPVVRQLAASLAENQLLPPLPLSNNNNGNGHIITEAGGSSTKAPLLGSKKNKKNKKMKDEHVVINVREVEIQEQRRSSSSSSSTMDRGLKVDSNDQGTSSASDLSTSTRIRSSSSSQNLLKKKWCRQVRIILAIDAAVCILLLVIWLVICHGIECIR